MPTLFSCKVFGACCTCLTCSHLPGRASASGTEPTASQQQAAEATTSQQQQPARSPSPGTVSPSNSLSEALQLEVRLLSFTSTNQLCEGCIEADTVSPRYGCWLQALHLRSYTKKHPLPFESWQQPARKHVIPSQIRT